MQVILLNSLLEQIKPRLLNGKNHINGQLEDLINTMCVCRYLFKKREREKKN